MHSQDRKNQRTSSAPLNEEILREVQKEVSQMQQEFLSGSSFEEYIQYGRETYKENQDCRQVNISTSQDQKAFSNALQLELQPEKLILSELAQDLKKSIDDYKDL